MTEGPDEPTEPDEPDVDTRQALNAKEKPYLPTTDVPDEKTNPTNQPDQMNPTNQMNRMNQTNRM